MNIGSLLKVVLAVFILILFQVVSADDAVLVLHFDEKGSAQLNDALDSSGYNNDGKIYDAVRDKGRVGNGLKFDGMKGYVEIPDSSSLRPKQFTISAWINPAISASSIDYIMPILVKTNSDAWYHAGGYDFYYAPDGLSLSTAYSSIWRRGVGVDVNLPVNKWTHVAATFDESTIKLYKNGVQIGSGNTNWPIQYSNDNIWIGRWYQITSDHSGGTERKGNYHFNGLIDEVLIFKRALSPQEIKSLYEKPYYNPDQKPKADFGADPTSGTAPLTVVFTDESTGNNLQYNWDFGDGSTSTVAGDVSHTYTLAGKYTIKMTVTNAAGSSTKSKKITVDPAPGPDSGTLLTAFWTIGPNSNTVIKNGIEGLTYTGVVTTDTNANGKKVIFDIYETDLQDLYLQHITSLDGIVNKERASVKWKAMYMDDGFLEGDPEYLFIARIDGSDKTVRSGNLVVKKKSPYISLPCSPDQTRSDKNDIVKYLGQKEVKPFETFDASIEIRPPQLKSSAASLIFLTQADIESFKIFTDKCSPGIEYDPTKSEGKVDYLHYSNEPLWTFITTAPDVVTLAFNTAIIYAQRPDLPVQVLNNVGYYLIFFSLGYTEPAAPVDNPPQLAMQVANNMMAGVDNKMKNDTIYVITHSQLDPGIPLMTKTGGTERESNCYQIKLKLKAPYQPGNYKITFSGQYSVLTHGSTKFYSIDRWDVLQNKLLALLNLGPFSYSKESICDSFVITVK